MSRPEYTSSQKRLHNLQSLSALLEQVDLPEWKRRVYEHILEKMRRGEVQKVYLLSPRKWVDHDR